MKDLKGRKNKIKKAGTTVISATLLTAGAVGIAFAYQSGSSFHPSGKKQNLKKNQVVFSKNKKMAAQNKQKEDNSRFLKNDQKNDQGANSRNDADYMFQNGMMMSQQKQVQVATNSNVQQSDDSSKDSGKNTYYQVTKDPSKADIVINQPSDTTDSNDPTNEGPNSNNSDSNNNSDHNSTSDKDHDSNNDNNSNNNSNDKNNDNKEDHNSDQKDPDKEDKPEARPSDTAKDPGSKKENYTDGLFQTKPFIDEITPFFDDEEDGTNKSVIITQSESNTNAILYKGQEIKEKDLFNALDTYVYGRDGYSYAWGDGAYDHYIKIQGVSFDGGQTWSDQYPVTIPSDVTPDQMKIKVGYRLSTKKDWATRIVDYEPKDGRVFLLSQKITEDNTTISDDIIVNKYQQYPELGSKMNFFRLQSDFLGYGRLTSLFPGWTEKGKLQPWFYEVKPGRHILEPEDMIPLDDKYVVRLRFFWMTNDGKIDQDGNNLIYLQTLTDMDEAITINWTDQDWTGSNLYDTISVPKYIQAISIDTSADISVNHLEVPDTVIYIKLDDTGMRVNDAYKVDENNEYYASNKEGLLMTKDQKQIIGIPYNTKKLEIGSSINRVRIEKKNQLSEIDLSQTSLDEIPELDYSRLTNCKIVVPDDLLISYIQQNYKEIFANKGNTIAAASEPDQEYRVEKGMIINKEGRMVLLLEKDREQLNLNESIHAIAADALNGAEELKTLVMPENGNIVTLEEHSLRGSSVKMIQCYSKEQYDNIVKRLEAADAPEDLTVQMIATSREGYKYYMKATEEKNDVVLMSVPKDITQFDGTMTDENGTKISITQIGNEAFAECKNLKWVTLPESIKVIKGKAFENCTALEGLLINSKDEITIGDGTFDGCSSLRFVASNAKKGVMENDYQPVITDTHGAYNQPNQFLYVPGDCEGYNKSCVSLTSGSSTPLTGYVIKDLGEDSKALYGVDDKENPWLLIRSGKEVPDQVTLPDQTIELMSCAMADTTSGSGSYQIDLSNLGAIGRGAFYASEISGDLTLKENVRVYEDAFRGCKNIKNVTIPGNQIYLGSDIFNECSKLETVKIGKLASNSSMQVGMFSGCDKLSDITLDSKEAENLILSDFSFPYQFNTEWTKEEEAQKLRIHIPEGSEEKYIKGWRYIYSGYVEMYGVSAYENMRQDIEFKNMDWTTWEVPTAEEVDVIQKSELLDAENRLRQMFGMSQVSQPTDLYLYHESDGMLTLADVTTEKKTLDLGKDDLELPEGWYLDYIGKGAFKNAKNLKKLTIPDNMAGIESNAFGDMQSGSLQLEFEGSTPLKLMLEKDNTPFEFGMDEENLKIKVPEGMENEYLKAWIFPMAGYEDYSAMAWDVISELSTGDDFPEMKTVYETMAKRLLPIENRLRKMMGMEEIDSIYKMCYKDEWELSEPETDPKSGDTSDNDTKDQDTKDTKESQDPTIDDSEKKEEETTKTTEAIQTEQTTAEETDDQKESTTEQEKQITIPDTMEQMESDLYMSEESDHLKLIFEEKTPLKLVPKEEGKAFSFGKDDDKITIQVPEGCEETYIEQWKYAMAGYKDLESMKKAVREDLKDEQVTEDQVNEIISQKLLLGENRLRKMMKMEELKK